MRLQFSGFQVGAPRPVEFSAFLRRFSFSYNLFSSASHPSFFLETGKQLLIK
jgi:hypothetical protein